MKASCTLCFHRCALEEGQVGLCGARALRGGAIVPLYYGTLTAMALDPIEKKPLRRFHPGSVILSVGSYGCNMHCPFCQNHEISMPSQPDAAANSIPPSALAAHAQALKGAGNIGVAYTYNEPLVGYEYVRDCAAEVRSRGLYNVLVTNGMIEPEPWRTLLTHIDAANIDLKGFTSAWYQRLGGDLETAKRSIALAADACHVEVTALLVPGENDSEPEIRALAGWLRTVDAAIPLHLTRFFPRYRMADKPPTPVARVMRLADAARESLTHVYTGNC